MPNRSGAIPWPPGSDGADYRVRIFTLDRELPFAGHPILGSAHAWLDSGGVPRQFGELVQECGAGLVPIRNDGDRLAFAAPPLQRSGPVDESLVAELCASLGLERRDVNDARWADNGPGWVALLLRDAATVLALEPDFGGPRDAGGVNVGIVGPYPPGGEYDFEVRAFFSDAGGAVREDPVTGTLNAALGQWLVGGGIASAPYVASQGARVGCAGRIEIDEDADGAVWVAGRR